MYVYIVYAPNAATFKFGLSTRPNANRLSTYKTAFGSFNSMVFACNNAHEVEAALKAEFADSIVPHDETGRLSEVVPRGPDDANVLAALRTILSFATISRHGEYIEPVIGDEAEVTAEPENEGVAADVDAPRPGESECSDSPDDDSESSEEESELDGLIWRAETAPHGFNLAEVAAYLLRDDLSYSRVSHGQWQSEEDDAHLDDDDVYLKVLRSVVEAATNYAGPRSKVAQAMSREKTVHEVVSLLQKMLKRKAVNLQHESPRVDVVDVLAGRFEFCSPFTDVNTCRRTGFMTKPRVVKRIVSELESDGELGPIRSETIISQLATRGYPKTENKVRFDSGEGVENTKWICGVRVKDEA